MNDKDIYITKLHGAKIKDAELTERVSRLEEQPSSTYWDLEEDHLVPTNDIDTIKVENIKNDDKLILKGTNGIKVGTDDTDYLTIDNKGNIKFPQSELTLKTNTLKHSSGNLGKIDSDGNLEIFHKGGDNLTLRGGKNIYKRYKYDSNKDTDCIEERIESTLDSKLNYNRTASLNNTETVFSIDLTDGIKYPTSWGDVVGIGRNCFVSNNESSSAKKLTTSDCLTSTFGDNIKMGIEQTFPWDEEKSNYVWGQGDTKIKLDAGYGHAITISHGKQSNDTEITNDTINLRATNQIYLEGSSRNNIVLDTGVTLRHHWDSRHYPNEGSMIEVKDKINLRSYEGIAINGKLIDYVTRHDKNITVIQCQSLLDELKAGTIECLELQGNFSLTLDDSERSYIWTKIEYLNDNFCISGLSLTDGVTQSESAVCTCAESSVLFSATYLKPTAIVTD